ncbi:unnamed protein product [Chondrus crispus]|uniref:CCAAT-binding factor domain-containing protein n=1 Tax=Chondrus crispus TaxID=2769 RepID=R7QRH8_CHOCR|nr:unnamed protein product [Chondrus crispus]CDF41092.1 unnamed protein product [Chondrus crispus]|eukprot:XP_005711386.1 unnamed protein product [Chondrus crispus]
MVSQSAFVSTTERIRALEKSFHAEGVKHANNLVEILKHVTPGDPGCTRAIHASRRILTALEKLAALEDVLRKWTQERRADYASALIAILASAAASELEKETAITGAALTHATIWSTFLKCAMEGKAEKTQKDVILDCFVKRFGDLRLTAMHLVKARAGDLDMRLEVMRYCAGPTEQKAARKSDVKVTDKDLRKAFGAAWVSLVADKSLSSEHRRDILERVPTELIPNMSDPLVLADFLNDSYNNGKDVSVATTALDGLFVLISKHGLDYPLFYPKLYALMSPDALFYANGRKRFLELSALFLRQGAMLPGGMVAAFVKRLTRRALMAPTEGALWCLRLAVDLLYKHPNVSYIVHRTVNLFDGTNTTGSVGKKRPRTDTTKDPFDDEELDPQASKADESSLWELEVLADHISPAVSRLVTSFSKDVRKNPPAPPGVLSDYTGLSFEDTFQAEFKRRAKSSHLAYDMPGRGPGVEEIGKKLQPCMEWA